MEIKVETQSLQLDDVAIDPMADWLMRSVDIENDTETKLNVLIQLKPDKTAAALEAAAKNILTTGGMPVFWMNQLYVLAKHPWDKATFCTAAILPLFLHRLTIDQGLQQCIHSVAICAPPSFMPDQPLAGGLRTREEVRLDADAVVTAVIDFGLPLFHPDLVQAGGRTTRVHAAWIQDSSPTSNAAPLQLRRRGLKEFNYGSEWFAKGMLPVPTSPVEETQHYDLAQLFIPANLGSYWTRSAVSHGSGVLGILAGTSQREKHGPKKAPTHGKNRPIILVQLPRETVADGSGHSLAAHLLDALRYVALEASYIKAGDKQAPVVVNLSYGNDAGPHDGQSAIELAMKEVVDLWDKQNTGIPFVIVTSAGNSYQAQLHARWMAEELANEQGIDWQIQPNDATPNIVQIWMPEGFAGEASVSLTAPGGESLTASTKAPFQTLRSKGEIIAQAQWFPATARGHHRGMFQLIVGATGRLPGHQGWASALAPAGTWKVGVQASGMSDKSEVHAWIQRDDYPLRREWPARQSYFQHEKYTRFRPITQPADGSSENGPLRRPGSISAIGTGAGTVVVGSGFQNFMDIPLYSGGGDAKLNGLAPGNGVDVIVSSDESPLLLGQIVMGMRGGSTARRFGTSIAAPIAAAHIADSMAMFAGGAGGPKDKIKAMVSTNIGGKGQQDYRGGQGKLV